ncbi:MAG TPA: glycosyltransferase [Gemmatimonadota bacterium]|nr:glycosyltransferase [Gemmatimonadota bacterium]
MSDSLGVVHTLARIDFVDGGPSRTVPALCRSLAAAGARVEIVTGAADSDPGVPFHISGAADRWGRRQPLQAPFTRLLRERLSAMESQVLHDHGIWLASNHAAAKVAARSNVSRIVSPRGMLSEWALAYKYRKKRIAWRMYQRRDLESADALHACSDMEADEIRAAGIGVPIAVIPNGVDLPPLSRKPPTRTKLRRFLFLSRIHPKKGLDVLVEAWGQVRLSGWELVIAGPNEGGHRGEIERRARALGPGSAISILDAVSDAEKWDLYRSADVFVLPTSSENFGVVVAEALASGVPVITTRAAPWAVLSECECGWWTELGVGPLAEAIGEAAGISDEERAAMGARGRRLVEERFGWASIARRMLAVYRWLAGDAPVPEWVRTS